LAQFTPASLHRLLKNVDRNVLVDSLNLEGMEEFSVLLGRTELLERLDRLLALSEAMFKETSAESKGDTLEFVAELLVAAPIPFSDLLALVILSIREYIIAEEGTEVTIPMLDAEPAEPGDEGGPERPPPAEIPPPPPIPDPLPSGLNNFGDLIRETNARASNLFGLLNDIRGNFHNFESFHLGDPWTANDETNLRNSIATVRTAQIEIANTLGLVRAIQTLL